MPKVVQIVLVAGILAPTLDQSIARPGESMPDQTCARAGTAAAANSRKTNNLALLMIPLKSAKRRDTRAILHNVLRARRVSFLLVLGADEVQLCMPVLGMRDTFAEARPLKLKRR
ncbi:MAG: hypothetical protein DMG31_16175 [Acidobacteria bacterium]|nr:MAG: hypothetical protein DMG31_16175 [Acidobacteriota bacterium]